MPNTALAPRRRKPGRTSDPAGTRDDILKIATSEFARKGLAGARIDEIAALTQTSKRMIYYYFTNKQGLYLAVLEHAYLNIRSIESSLKLDSLSPEDAVRTMVGFTFDYQAGNPDFVRLVMNENIHHGKYLAQSASIKDLNVTAIKAIEDIYGRGCKQGLFRPDLDPIDIHASISALSFFNVANQYTFSLIFKRDTQTAEAHAERRENVIQMVLRYLRK
ncbi:MAG: TetR family transcriptional regulator [Alcaligenaceae bacterium]|nr:TetR family transcriptional regulator [Alcaligenaceae bacterium]